MNYNALSYSLGILSVLTACSPKTTPASSSRGTANVVNYNSYTDDLTAARPSYTLTAKAPAKPGFAPPVSKADAIVTPARKTASPPERVPAEALHVNKKLDALLDTIAQKNRSVRYASGYRIQVYVGNERQEADAAKLQVYQSFPELSPYLSYKQPTYRLKVGDFMRRLDAEWYLNQLKQQFTSVILQADKVDIRRSLLMK